MKTLVQLYYRILMGSLRLVTGHKTIQTWTFHKGCLRILGNDWEVRKPKRSLLRIIWTVLYPASYILLLGISVVLTVKNAITILKHQGKSGDILQFIRAMNGFIVSIAYVYAAAKGIIFKAQGGQLLRLMDMLDELGEQDDDGRPHRDRALLNCTLYMGLLFVTPGAWTIYFVFFHQAIPYPTEFPWSEDTHLGYFASFSTDFVTAVYCAALHSVYDTMFPMVVGVISGHLASLKAKLAKFGGGGLDGKEESVLRKCHLKHVDILRIMKHMNDCFRLLFLVQTTYTVLHACVIIYQVMQVSDIALAIMNTSPILSSAYSQLLMYCYYGQLLTTNFEELKEGLYENKWYNCDGRTKKSLCLMTLMADRPVRLESYGITSAAHHTYLSSLQDSISYYLILKTLTTEE
uniref:Odorant receptor n=1 Tax=Yemma signatus TaxID=300820 RepID=A0A385H695_9HEMI|nr:odorant receptor [Yemma signatus]